MKLALPIIIGNVGQTLITLTDNVMVGRLGADSLGAAGFAGGLFFVFLVFGLGVLAPTSALFARFHGTKEHDEGGELLRHTIFSVLILTAGLSLAMVLMKPFMHHMGQTTEVAELSGPFFNILIVSLFPSLIYQAYKQFSDGIGKTKVGMYVMIAAILLNILGNYIFIHGLLGLPAMGLNGSAMASLLSRAFMALVMMFYIHRHPEFKLYFARKWRRALERHQLKNIFRLGLPNGLTYIFEVGAFTFSSIMMGWLGAPPLAAHQIALNLASMSFLVTVGIGAAASIRIGFEMGQGEPEKAHFAGRVALILGAVYMLVSACFVYGFRDTLAGFYTTDLVVVKFAAAYLAVAAAFQFFDGVQAVAVGTLRGLQDTKWPSILAFIAYWIIGLPIGYYLAFQRDWQGEGIWWGLFLGLAFTALSLTLRYERLAKRQRKL